MARTAVETELKVADEVWIATALLHREHPESADFTVDEIVERAKKEGLHKPLRRGVYVHAIQHCVANRPPNPGRYRMLVETRPGHRRLFRIGDSYDPQREGAKITPELENLPPRYSKLLDWYAGWNATFAAQRTDEDDPILALVGSGKHLWQDEDPDEYVRSLREGWE